MRAPAGGARMSPGDLRAHAERSLEVMRQRLLDLKTSNVLLNLRVGGRSYVRVVDEVPEQIFDELSNGRVFEFRPVADPRPAEGDEGPPDVVAAARATGLDPSFELPERIGMPHEKHSDDLIQTLLFRVDLESVLERLRRRSKSLLEELGVPTLHIAFGSLEWFDSDNSDRPLLAPLVLLQVQLTRDLRAGRYRYRIRCEPETAAQTNGTLRIKLRRDFSLELPELEEDTDLGLYLRSVRALVEGQRRWQVHRHVTVGIFRFERLVMFEDLGADDWAPKEHPLLKRLLAVTPDRSEPSEDTPDLDAPEFEASAPLLVADADSSQTIAVADALGGHNLVVRGPPGTGKSQTITNLIAAAMAEGKSVLFVAEKMAALDVVRKRLDDASLGEFALELHSTKASKRAVLNRIKTRLEMASLPTASVTHDEKRRNLRQTRDQLNEYLRVIHAPFGATGATLFDVLWRQEQLRPTADTRWFPVLAQVQLPSVLELTEEALSREGEALKLFALRRAAIRPNSRDGHPWADLFDPGDFEFVAEETIAASARAWAEALRALSAIAAPMLAEGQPPTVACAGRAVEGALALDRPSLRAAPLADALGSTALRVGARALLPAVKKLAAFREHALSENLSPDRVVACQLAIQQVLTFCASGVTTLAELEGRLQREIRSFAELEAMAAHVRRTCALLGWRVAELTPSIVRALLQLVDVVAAASRDVLLARCDALLDEKPPGVVARLAAQVTALREHVAEVDEWASGWRHGDALTFRSAALVLREAGLWDRWFGAEYRAARRSAVAVLRGAKLRREALAARAERCAEVLEELKALQDDDSLRRLMPTGSDWSTVDLDLVRAVDAWATEVRSATVGLGEFPGLVRGAAFRAPTETLAAVIQTLGPMREQLHAILGNWTNGDLGATSADARSRVERGLEATNALFRAGFRREVTVDTLQRLLELSAETSDCTQVIERHEFVVAALGPAWSAVLRDPADLECALDWTERAEGIARESGLKTRGAEPWSVWLEGLLKWAVAAEAVLQTEGQARQAAASKGIAVERVLRASNDEIDRAVRILSRAAAAPDVLRDWLLYVQSWRAASQHARLAPVLTAVWSLDDDLEGIERGYAWLVYRQLANEAGRRYRALGADAWSGDHLTTIRSRFAELDREVLVTQQQEIRARLHRKPVPAGTSSGPRANWTDLALVTHEVSKQKKHIAIRSLVSRSQGALLALTPCFMMSPLSVAQFLPRVTGMFDLLIIDEASQMRPEDAVGALARAKQAVIVGDENQLPPTSFFESTNEDDLPDDDAHIDERLESILDWGRSSFSHTRELLWHYRSRHESLIAFSNDRFYNGRLLIFPSPATSGATAGVRLRSVAGAYSGSTNQEEARVVADAVAAFMKEQRHRTLGVVAMNKPQAELIERMVDDEIRRAGDDSYREHWASTLSPFFVKNLESVQGDERDVMFVSLTYGPASPGGAVFQRFGPINGDDGHRRLNVLFTRAREQLTVFSSMRPSDIRVEASTKRGVRTLRDYLEYAANDGRLLARGSARQRAGYDSAFEESVAGILQAEGFDTEPQVGVQGFFIDLGIRHTSHSAGFICGVECDGAAYHSTRSARDRDRIRQAVLESLGWRIIRVWSTDWFRSPTQARQKLVRDVRAALDVALREQHSKGQEHTRGP